jgi:hypothetical protein
MLLLLLLHKEQGQVEVPISLRYGSEYRCSHRSIHFLFLWTQPATYLLRSPPDLLAPGRAAEMFLLRFARLPFLCVGAAYPEELDGPLLVLTLRFPAAATRWGRQNVNRTRSALPRIVTLDASSSTALHSREVLSQVPSVRTTAITGWLKDLNYTVVLWSCRESFPWGSRGVSCYVLLYHAELFTAGTCLLSVAVDTNLNACACLYGLLTESRSLRGRHGSWMEWLELSLDVDCWSRPRTDWWEGIGWRRLLSAVFPASSIKSNAEETIGR